MYVQTKHETSLDGWFDDALSALNTAVTSANQACQVINSSTGQVIQAAGGAILPTSGANVVNQATGYVNGVCSVIKPSTATPGLPTAGTKAETAAPKFPAGSIATYSPTRGGYRIAVPTAAVGSLNLTLEGDLGAPAFVETGISPTLPTGVIQVPESQFNKSIGEWYTTWWFKTAVGIGGVSVIGTIAWAILR